MKTTISEFKQKYPKLILNFEKKTGHKAIYHNKITKNFIHWLREKIKYKTLICPECDREFDSKKGLAAHKIWHKPGYREKKSKITIKLWQDPKFRKSMTNIRGENNPNYGKFGEEHPSYKEDAGYVAKHEWINKHYPQKNVCNDKCEICGKINLNLDLAQFRHINVRNMDDPIIDYLYMCPYNEKDGCHRIYDDNLSDEQKKELLKGATTREEKLNGIRKYILKQKEEIKNV